jgi:hypothetical protein
MTGGLSLRQTTTGRSSRNPFPSLAGFSRSLEIPAATRQLPAAGRMRSRIQGEEKPLPDPYLKETRHLFRKYRQTAEAAMAQVADADLFRQLDSESNSIAIIVKHIGGNLRSRWTDFLTTDGEKLDRLRDSEFEAPPATRAALMAFWEQGWNPLHSTLDSLTDADLGRTVYIRGEAHSVLKAIQRSLAHIASHVGQIVFLAKHLAGRRWTTLSIPRSQSEAFNRRPHLP